MQSVTEYMANSNYSYGDATNYGYVETTVSYNAGEGEYNCNENYEENYQEEYQEDYKRGDNQTQGDEDSSNQDRERDRDRSRRKHRERRRDRRHDKDRSKTRDRDRDRDRGRDGRESRDRDRRDRDRDRSSLRDSERYEDFDEEDSPDRRDSYERRDSRESRDGREERGGEKWMTDTPTNTVLLRGLAPLVEEKDIRAVLQMFGAPIKDVRLMRRSTGASRGFAFVEFQNIADAQRWMDLNQVVKHRRSARLHRALIDANRNGKLVIQNQYYATMHYSTPKTGQDKGPVHKTDWSCSKCGVHNFKRRDHCFKCNLSREESDKKNEADGFDQVGTNPCNTLIFRGLDALTTEDNLIMALTHVTSAGLKNIRIIRDDLTNTSRGYGFLEMNTVMESTQLLETITQLHPPFEVDGKQILVSFAKNTFSTVMATLSADASQQSTWDYSQQGYYDNSFYQGGEYDQSQYYDGQYDYSQYYDQSQYQQAQSTNTATTTMPQVPAAPTQTDSTNAAAAVAQAAIQQAHAVKNFNKQPHGRNKTKQPSADQQHPTAVQLEVQNNQTSLYQDQRQQSQQQQQDYPVYPPPDVSTYQYDESSGYYFDPQTNLYYDASSQYFYNAQTSQFLYWDAERSTYLPAPTGEEQKEENGDKLKKKEEKKEKVKVAKKIAKDMEKWAKTLNAQKDAIKGFNKTFQTASSVGKSSEFKESATADAGYAILEKSAKGNLEDKKLMPPPPAVGGASADKPHLVAQYGGDSDSDDNDDSSGPLGGSGPVIDESKLSDWNKLACLLCKRQFQTKEILIKHTQMSDLHKQNLEALYKSRGMGGLNSAGTDSSQLQYRDRAKERREKYGIPPPPEPKKRHDREAPISYEQPNNTGIEEANIGNKLLQKMGWSAGQGLGRSKQGIVKPIEASRRSAGAGLGMRGANVVAGAGDTYKDAVKKTMFARYNEVE